MYSRLADILVDQWFRLWRCHTRLVVLLFFIMTIFIIFAATMHQIVPYQMFCLLTVKQQGHEETFKEAGTQS